MPIVAAALPVSLAAAASEDCDAELPLLEPPEPPLDDPDVEDGELLEADALLLPPPLALAMDAFIPPQVTLWQAVRAVRSLGLAAVHWASHSVQML